MSRVAGTCLLVVVLLLCSSCAVERRSAAKVAAIEAERPPVVRHTLETGHLQGADYAIADPLNWRGKVLILAHGWRPPDAPLVAELNPTDPAVDRLLQEGWIVAATSYRRNGLIIADALLDLRSLARHIVTTRGQPELLLLEGVSMGASIGILAAESVGDSAPGDQEPPVVFSGVLAIGADPERPGLAGTLPLSHQPGVPLLLLSNRGELEPAARYVAATAQAAVPPALWRLERDGHVNLSSRERVTALEALERWALGGQRAPGTAPDGWDATISTAELRSTARPGKGGMTGKVARVDRVYGNVDTDLVARDLEAIEVQVGDWFQVLCGANTQQVLLGHGFADVAAGQFVAFLTAEGYLRIASNLDNAAATLRCHAGDSIMILPAEPGKESR